MSENIPADPMLLVSYLNTKLRDFYVTLDSLCEDMELDKETLLETCNSIDFQYDETLNKFL